MDVRRVEVPGSSKSLGSSSQLKEVFFRGESSDGLLEPSLALDGRYPHLDVTRFCCITALFMFTAQEGLVLTNVTFVQEWALPLLWLMGGICFAKSERNIFQYLGRLLLVVLLGFGLNWTVWALQNRPWKQQAWSMCGQMIYPMVLLISLALLAPLKHFVLRPFAEARQRLPLSEADRSLYKSWRLQAWVFLGGGLLGFVIIAEMLLGPVLGSFLQSRPGQDLFRVLGIAIKDTAVAGLAIARGMEVCVGGLWIVGCYLKLFDNQAMLAWVLLIYYYCHRLLFGWDASDLCCHCFYLVLVAMCATAFGMTKRRPIGLWTRRYWMLPGLACGLLWTPEMVGNMTTQFPGKLGGFLRSRFVITEVIMVTTWLTGGQYMADPKIFSEDGLSFMSDWSLLVFVLHKAAFWFLGPDFAYAFLGMLAPLCWFLKNN